MADVLKQWLEGKPLADLDASEQDLRAAFAEVQRGIGELTEAVAQRDRLNESMRKLNAMVGAWSQQAEKESLVFGEWPGDGLSPEDLAFWRGYLCGRGGMARVYQRQLEFLANVIRSRAYADLKTREGF